MNRLKGALGLFVGVVALSLWMAPPAAGSGVRLSGKVSDPDGKPIDEVTIEITETKSARTWTAKTKKNGQWAAIVEGSEWKFVATADGYAPVEDQRPLESLGRKPTLNFTLVPGNAAATPVPLAAAPEPEGTPQPQIDLADLKAGNDLFDQGQYKEAIASYQVALEKNPTIDKIHISIGDSYAKLDDYASAAEQYKLVPDTDAMADRAQLSLADAYLRLKKIDDAVAMYKKVLAANPQNPDANYVLGQVIFNQKNDAQAALPYLVAAVEAKPDWAAAQIKLGYVYVNLGDNAKAKAAFEKAIELEPTNAEAKSMLEMFK